MNKPRIIHVATTFPPALGGMEKVAAILANESHKNGYKVSVITSDQRSGGHDINNDKYSILRLKSYIIANTTIIPFLFFELLKVKPKNDIVHLHITQAFVPEMVLIASLIIRFKYIAHIHIDLPKSGRMGFLLGAYKKIFLSKVLRNASYVSVFTADQKEEYINRYKLKNERVVVIPNGVEDKFYFPSRNKVNSKINRLLFVGRLDFQKNIIMLINALDGISDKYFLDIVGDGSQAAELAELLINNKIRNVVLHGRVDGVELESYYKNAQIFILPSLTEGMPLVILEAMASGLPIIATDVPGSRDVVKNNVNGYLVPLNDVNSLRQAILRLSSNEKRYLDFAKSSRKLATQYSWEKIAKSFEKLYGNIYELQ